MQNRLLPALLALAGLLSSLTATAGTCERLQEIGAQYRIGVISNADGKIDQVLAKCDIAHCFRTITDSGLVGFEKPHPEIFHRTLRALGVMPAETRWHDGIPQRFCFSPSC